jgi:oligopeptide transport system ATP-binding protein
MSNKPSTSSPFVRVTQLSKRFEVGLTMRRKVIRAVDDVSFEIAKGHTLGLVGESGSGKSTIGRLVVGLLPASQGSVEIGGISFDPKRKGAARALWRDMQMVFQDPYSSLNPRMTIRDTLAEPLHNFRIAKGAEADRLIRSTLNSCGLPVTALDRYPREFSGGQRQRVGIARALIVRPKFIIADEPVSALDVSIQAQIINLVQDLKAEYGLTYLFIAHDLAVVRHVADELAVMYRGKIIEIGAADAIYKDPKHPYTKLLIRSIPIPDRKLEASRRRSLTAVSRDFADTGCNFASRCPMAMRVCVEQAPLLVANGVHRKVACHFATGPTVVAETQIRTKQEG